MTTRQIERVGKTDGQWPRYHFKVDGINLGLIRRVTVKYDGIACTSGKRRARYSAWEVTGVLQCESRERAEAFLIERAERLGTITKEA